MIYTEICKQTINIAPFRFAPSIFFLIFCEHVKPHHILCYCMLNSVTFSSPAHSNKKFPVMVSTLPYKSFRFILINNCAHIASREVGFKEITKDDSKTSLAAICVMIFDELWWRYSNMKQDDKQCLYLFSLHNWAQLVSYMMCPQTNMI